jgi:nicotinamidase-related amidase
MKTAVVVLDLINEFCHVNGKMAKYADRIQEKGIIEKANQLVEWARQQNHLIAYVRVGFNPHYKDASAVSPIFSLASKNKALNLSEWGAQFCDELAVDKNDVCVIKHRVSAFYGTDLDLILRANRIERLILAGIATNNAVELTAREAHDRDYQVTVISDACTTNTDVAHQASLDFLQRISTVSPLKEVIV